MTITNNLASKLAIAFVAIAMAFTLAAPSVKAQDVSSMSLEQLIALVNQLQAQLSGSANSSSTCTYTFTRSLGQGATGADVMNLQKFLNSDPDTVVALSGAGSPGMETSYYGSLTASAVSKFQVKYSGDILVPVGLSTPTGYFGPSSMAKANALCDGMMNEDDDEDDNDNGGALQGGAGNIGDADFISSLNNEEVGEGDDDVEVAGLEIEAEGSDIELTAVNLNFDWLDDVSGSSDDFDDYASEVSIWFDGEEVGRVDVDDMDDDDWSENISLDKGAIIREGDTADLVVAVTAASNIDGDDLGENWNVSFDSVRFRDAQGAVITETNEGEIGANNEENTTTDDGEREFSFESFATSNDIELRISDGDDDINDSRLLQVDDNDESDDIELFSFMVEVEGDSDLTVDEIVATSSITGTADNLNDLFGELRLYMDGDLVGSENAPGADVVTFDDLDLELEPGEYEFVIEVDILEYTESGGSYDLDDTISMSVDQTEREAWDVEDEEGDDVENGDRKGSASTEEHSFTESGVTIDGYSWTEASTGTFLDFFFTVKVDDEDFDVLQSSIASSTSGTATTSVGVLSVVGDSSDTSSISGGYTVESGGEARFRVRYAVNGDEGDYVDVTISSVAGQKVPSGDQLSPTAVIDLN